MKQRVLFICVHNSARSQMAEAFLGEICGDQFEAHSAGLEPGELNPLAVEAMREIGTDISQRQTQSVFDVFKSGELFSYVITVCDETSAERCPIFPGVAKRLHWSFPDPAALTGTREERLIGMCDHIDNGIADADDIDAGRLHLYYGPGGRKRAASIGAFPFPARRWRPCRAISGSFGRHIPGYSRNFTEKCSDLRI